MFVGHYGVSFAAKKLDRSIPLWVLFLAVQFLDVLWSIFVFLGIEKVRIVPGFTATNPLDLYYMPYSHGLPCAVVWSVMVAIAYQLFARPARRTTSLLVGFAVFSHWLLDLIVHRPDLPLYENTAKVGLGLWNYPALALGLEIVLLFGGMWLCLKGRPRSIGTIVFGVVMVAVQVYVFFGPPPPSDRAAASTALVAYVVFAAVIWWLQDRRPAARAV